MIAVSKHFKFVGIAIMALLAIVVIYGWSKAENNKKIVINPQSQPQKQIGIHPNIEQKKKPCNVCQAKKMQQQQQAQLPQAAQSQNNWM